MAPHHYPLPVLQHPRRNHYAHTSIKFIRSANWICYKSTSPSTYRRTPSGTVGRADSVDLFRINFLSRGMVVYKNNLERKCFATNKPHPRRTNVRHRAQSAKPMRFVRKSRMNVLYEKYEIIYFFREVHDPYFFWHRVLRHRHACRRAFYPCKHRVQL